VLTLSIRRLLQARVLFPLAGAAVILLALSLPLFAAPAHAQTPTTPTAPAAPTPNAPSPTGDDASGADDATISVSVSDSDGGTTQPVLIILLITVLSIAPAALMMVTAFTRIVIVLSLTRNALGLPTIPPTQVVIGLSLFLTLFVMAPVFSEVNEVAVQPLLNNEIDQKEAFERAEVPIKGWMLEQTRKGDLEFFVNMSDQPKPETPEDVELTTLIPAFILSELKTAFIIGFVILVPFLVIDMVVSSVLMSMGMFMLPPVLVALPFKLLLFVLVDGWQLVVENLLRSFN